MVDYHSHILPGIDDGSQSVEESRGLLSLLWEQGVRTVCATPHFDAARLSPADFFLKRQNAYEALAAALPTDGAAPRILLGAEVAFFSGISQMEGLSSLCIEGTKLLLLEMPFSLWSEYTLRELAALSCSSEFTVLLAHIERYLPYQKIATLRRLGELDVMMQANAASFIHRKTRRRALRMLKNGEIHALGSDCHNLTTRKPLIGKASEIIAGRFGAECLDHISEYTSTLLGISK